MEQERLEHLAWEAMDIISKDRRRKYSAIDLMEGLNINILEANEIAEFLV